MKGFADKAILLFPDIDTWRYRSTSYKNRFNKAVGNLKTLLDKSDMKPVCLTTDEVAIECMSDCMWARTTNQGDTFFIETNCYDMDYTFPGAIDYPEIYQKALHKYPSKRGQSIESRFTDVLKRVNFAAHCIIKEYKVIVIFGKHYKVTPKDGDGKLIICIDDVSLIPKTYMSGQLIDSCRLLGFGNANHSVDAWEV